MTQSYQTVQVEDRDNVRIIRLNRPEKKNAFNIRQAVDMRDAFVAAGADDNVRVIVWTGAGDAFSAGADMNTFAGQDTSADPSDLPLIGSLHVSLMQIEKPMIAAVNGLAVGMGVTLLPFFDMVYAADTATFRTPFAAIGIVLEYASSYTLPRLIGRQRASEMALRAKAIDARTAETWGLVTRVFPKDSLLTEVLQIATDVASNGPRAVRLSKKLLWEAESMTLSEAFDNEQKVLATCYGSDEHMKQVMAFFARKKG